MCNGGNTKSAPGNFCPHFQHHALSAQFTILRMPKTSLKKLNTSFAFPLNHKFGVIFCVSFEHSNIEPTYSTDCRERVSMSSRTSFASSIGVLICTLPLADSSGVMRPTSREKPCIIHHIAIPITTRSPVIEKSVLMQRVERESLLRTFCLRAWF